LDASIVQGPFSVAPCLTLISRFATFASPYAGACDLHGGARRRRAGGAGRGVRGLAAGGLRSTRRGDAAHALQPGLSHCVSLTVLSLPVSFSLCCLSHCLSHCVACPSLSLTVLSLQDWATQPTWHGPPRGGSMAAVVDWWEEGGGWVEGRREAPAADTARWQRALTARVHVLHLLHALHHHHRAGAAQEVRP
jgi:hypothetical protein